MAEWLVLRLPSAPGGDACWMAVDAGGRMIEAPVTGPLAQAAPLAAGRRVCALVPGTDVLLADVEVPAKSGAKLQQVVPFALEEQLAQDVEDLHFALGRRASGSLRTPVAVASHALMKEWIETVRAAGLSAQALYADSDLIPANPGQAVAVLEADSVIVRPAGGAPVTLPLDALGEALELARPTPQAIVPERSGAGSLLLYAGPREWHQYSQQIEAVRERFDGIKVQLLAGGALALYAQQVPAGTAVNLLQGAYAPAGSAASGWRRWRLAAILLAGLIGLHVAGRIAQLALLHHADRSLDTAIAQTFRQAMPGDHNPVNARRRMAQRLLELRGNTDSGLLPALAALAQARSKVPGTSVQSLSFRAGVLDLKIDAPDADSLDHLSQALRADGWQAALTSGNAAGSLYQGEIQLKPRSS